MEKPRNRIVIDTSIWLLACARKTTGDEMSRVDRQLNEASASQNPKKYRGFLARMLVTHDVIVPTVVLTELKNIYSGGILDRSEIGNLGKLVHRDNKTDLEILINAMEGLTTEAIPTKKHVVRQAGIWEAIKNMPNEERRWEEKFSKHESAVRSAAQKASVIVGEEPWIQARREWKTRLQQRDSAPSPELSKEINFWKTEMERTRPHLVSDYEILLVAEATHASVASRDRDYQLMWLGSEELSQKFFLKPVIIKALKDEQAPETSPQKLGEAIRQKVRPVPLEAGPTFS